MTSEVFQKVEPETKVCGGGWLLMLYLSYVSHSEVSLTYSASHMEMLKQIIILE